MEYHVVGCGLSGAVIARHLAERGNKVMIWERRNHIAGNMYDYHDEYGNPSSLYSIGRTAKKAIEHAIKMANKNDIIVLAGKGHEPYQEINGEKNPFDERIIVKDIINKM